MQVIFDIETNGLYNETTEIHCISVKVDDKPTLVYTSKPIKGSSGTIDDALDILSRADVLIGHNIIKFDLPVIRKLNWTWDYKGKIIDTLIVSKLKYPNIGLTDSNRKNFPPKMIGSHSLKAWGYRVRKYKGDYNQKEDAWDILTEDMVEYCRQDTEVTATVFERMVSSGLPPEQALWIEQEFATIISRQEKYGVYFNVEEAQKLHIEILEEAEAITKEVTETFGYIVKPGEVKTPANNRTLIKRQPYPVRYFKDVPYCTVTFDQFNPGSRDHIYKVLVDKYNWKPTEYTEKGSPIVNESVLSSLEYPEAKLLNKYLTIRKLLGQLAEGDNAWLKCVNSTTNRIYGSVDTLGAVSRRCTHNRPNMAQVPSNRAFKGHECRALFTVPKGKKLVGCDADALELRTLSHYMARHDNGKYATAVDEGKKENGTDIHTLNQKAAGLPDRDTAKTFIYAFLYGAGDEKIGTIVDGTKEDGASLKATFFKKIPAIKSLLDGVKGTYRKTKTIKALDGNPYYIRSEHSALNTLLQGAGALVMKVYLVLLDKNLEKYYRNSRNNTMDRVQYEYVLNVHDEVQIECDEEIAEHVAKICESTFSDVTAYLKFRIPLRGNADIGDDWSQTH